MERTVIVGGGHMGAVIARRLAHERPGTPVTVVEAASGRAADLAGDRALTVVAAYAPEPGDLLVLAVPPTALDRFAAELPAGALHDVTVVSVMAGVRLETLEARLGTARVLRAMPNLAAQVGRSMTLLCAGPGVGAGDVAAVQTELSAIGAVQLVLDESDLDAGTALAGSGPAFVAYVARAFTRFAAQEGFNDAAGLRLTCQVLRGTADLLEASGTDPERLYRQAATPGGTTAEGITCLEEHDLQAVVVEALERAAARSRRLAARPAGGPGDGRSPGRRP
ncbi:NAD(P)-binding domain-containing protein [Streptomyces sp. SID5785]|nr:NAD(P)-binding domain-containing protein [Streptomyces sp. SID5785]